MKEIGKATVMHVRHGWEMDNYACAYESKDGMRYLITTCYGREKEMTVEDIDLKIEETENSLIGLKKLRDMVAG